MSKEEVLSIAAKRNMFLSPDALDAIMSDDDPIGFTHTVLSSLVDNPVFVTREDVVKFINGEKTLHEPVKTDKPRVSRNLDMKVIDGTDITGNSTCVGDISDFKRYFQNRFRILKRIIERRSDFGQSRQIRDAFSIHDRDVRIIGIVNEKKITSNGHMMLTVEDDGGDKDSFCSVFISKESELFNEVITNDMVIGLSGRFGRPRQNSNKGMFIPTGIFKPSVPKSHAWIPSDSQSMVAFLSDVHIGSITFLEKNWKKMISFLKENCEKMQINYIIFPGDVVDGIGIFPGQENELKILDIYDQYKALSEYLKEIPDSIQMALHPGNHDACRPAEPQPALNKKFTQYFDSNIMMTGNPVYLKIEGRTLLSYHGRSIDDWVSSVQQLTYEEPLNTMQQMVEARHLAPVYGMKTALAPESKDYLAIDIVPDIFVSGHVHGYGIREWRGIRMINASTWQSQTDYQKQHNFNPYPGIMPLVHLGTGEVVMKSFMKD